METVKTLSPKMKIVGIENDLSIQDLQRDINDRNFEELNSEIKVIHIYKSKNNTFSAIIETPSEIYEFIKKNNSKVYDGSKRCVAYDDINFKICKKCCRYNHSDNKCRNTPTCLHCAGSHELSNCVNKETNPLCTNCKYTNDKYNTKHDTNHSSHDTEKCAILNNKIRKYIQNFDYPIAPNIQSLLRVKIKKKDNQNDKIG